MEGFDFGNKVQTIYEALPNETKQDIQARSNTNRKDFGAKVFVLALLGSLSDNKQDKVLSEKAMGFATSLMLKN